MFDEVLMISLDINGGDKDNEKNVRTPGVASRIYTVHCTRKS